MSKKVAMPFYYDWATPLEDVPDKDFKRLVLSMVKYHRDGTPPPSFVPPDYEVSTKMAAQFIFPQIDRAKTNADNGRKGGKATQSNDFGSTDGSTVGSSTNTNTNTNTNTSTNTFTNTQTTDKPTLEQVREYVKEQNINANPDEFYNCYEAVGWTSKGEPIKNWKALLSVWGKNENGRAVKQSKGMVQPIGDFEQRLTEEDKELLGKHRLPRTSILPQ